MTDTPETDDLARGNHVVPTEFAEQLERERDKARAKIITSLEWSAALADLEHDLRAELKEAREQRDGLRSGIEYASDQLTILTQQRDRLTEALEYILGIGLTEKTRAKAEKALQSLTQNDL